MARETEIKLKITDVPAFHRALKRIGARPAGPRSSRVHEENVIFDTPQGGLAKHGQLLRIRTETLEVRRRSRDGKRRQRVVVTFKRPIARPASLDAGESPHGFHKVREEIEVEVAETAKLTEIFEGLGMSGWFSYEKYRRAFQLPAKN